MDASAWEMSSFLSNSSCESGLKYYKSEAVTKNRPTKNEFKISQFDTKSNVNDEQSQDYTSTACSVTVCSKFSVIWKLKILVENIMN